jgi:hypothetical protein
MGRDGGQSAHRAGHHRQGEAQEKDVATESHGDTTKRGRTFSTSVLIRRDTLAPCQDRTFCHVVARRDESEHERRRHHPLRRGHCPPEPSDLLHDAVAPLRTRQPHPAGRDPPPHPASSRRRRAPVPRARPSADRSTVGTSAAGVGRAGSRDGAHAVRPTQHLAITVLSRRRCSHTVRQFFAYSSLPRECRTIKIPRPLIRQDPSCAFGLERDARRTPRP